MTPRRSRKSIMDEQTSLQFCRQVDLMALAKNKRHSAAEEGTWQHETD